MLNRKPGKEVWMGLHRTIGMRYERSRAFGGLDSGITKVLFVLYVDEGSRVLIKKGGILRGMMSEESRVLAKF